MIIIINIFINLKESIERSCDGVVQFWKNIVLLCLEFSPHSVYIFQKYVKIVIT